MHNIFDHIPATLDAELFTRLVDSELIRIERIVSRGQCSPEAHWYDQAENEWVLLLKGAATLQFADGSTLNLSAGDYLTIPAHRKHKVLWTAPDTETVWLAVHY